MLWITCLCIHAQSMTNESGDLGRETVSGSWLRLVNRISEVFSVCSNARLHISRRFKVQRHETRQQLSWDMEIINLDSIVLIFHKLYQLLGTPSSSVLLVVDFLDKNDASTFSLFKKKTRFLLILKIIQGEKYKF